MLIGLLISLPLKPLMMQHLRCEKSLSCPGIKVSESGVIFMAIDGRYMLITPYVILEKILILQNNGKHADFSSKKDIKKLLRAQNMFSGTKI